MSIKAIFYCRFDPHHGPKVIHQVPELSVLTTTDLSASTSSTLPAPSALLSFPNVSRFLIPRQSLCGNLISLSPPALTPQAPPCLILSYPICLTSSHYVRNEFIFNFCIVLAHPSTSDIDVPSYRSVVVKLAHLMRSLEEQSNFLSNDTSAPNSGPIYSLCEMLMEDLNNYCECMIPIDELNTLNIKLFPTLPDPPKIQPWHVPLFTVRIETLVDENWDLTMQRIIPFINGVNSVKRIAGLADADLKLTRKCIKHLVYYGCVILLDIFSFNAIYSPTSQFGEMIAKDVAMQRECARYVNTKFAEMGKEEAVVMDERRSLEDDIWPLTGKGEAIDGVTIVQLFASLRQGLSVREWYAMNANLLSNVDLRRFITFGVIKGFLYRVHRYAIKTGKSKMNGDKTRQDLPRSISSEIHLTKTPGVRGDKRRKKDDDEGEIDVNARLLKYLDGTHCFDEICTDLAISERELMKRLESKDLGEVITICR